MSDYCRDGTIGIGTPQANPTVEAEMAILLPPTVARVTTRLTSGLVAAEERLHAYLEGIEAALETFDTLRPDAFGFACTASSYLLAPGREATLVAAAAARFGYPVVTAASAIEARLHAIGARRIALLSPYPPALAAAAKDYWTRRGFVIASTASVPIAGTDTRGIYALGSGDARAALASLGGLSLDALLVTGTGMPSLPLIATAPADAPPVLSSNLALATVLLDRIGVAPDDWRPRLQAATGATT